MARIASHIDFETRSAAELKTVGLYNYAVHPTTWVWCMSWKIGSGPVRRWRPGDADPQELLDWIELGLPCVAHNASFERAIWNLLIRARIAPHWPALAVSQQDCTMARAQALALPGDLDRLGTVLRLTTQKDKEGSALMRKMAKPRKPRKGEQVTPDDHGCVWHDLPEQIDRLMEYCDVDVEAEDAADRVLLALTPHERKVWEWDQLVNERGFRVDVAAVEKLLKVVDVAMRRANEKMAWLTDGAVQKCSEAAKIAAWITANGVPCASIAKGEIEELSLRAEEVGDPRIKAVLELRREAAKSSTAKLQRMLDCSGEGDRARGLFVYCGANTGRWSGRLIQPHNLPRCDEERDLPHVMTLLDLLDGTNDAEELHDRIDLMVGSPMPWVSKSLRAMIIADPGKRLLGADFSNIEGRYNAWSAQETWKLDAFRTYDRGEGADLYVLAYQKSFGGELIDIRGPKRQVGKVQELSMGYQGAVGAFIAMAAGYGVKAANIVPLVHEATPEKMWTTVAGLYDKERMKHGLTRDEWTAVKCVVKGWRQGHPEIVQGWWDRQDAAIEAVLNPGVVTPVLDGRVRYLSAQGFLWTALPSGRLLAYCRPRVVVEQKRTLVMPDGGELDADEFLPDELELMQELGAQLFESRPRRKVLFEGVDPKTKQWGTKALYGGLQCENDTQAGARDVLVYAAESCETAGYPIILHVHDELVAEVADGIGGHKELERIMSKLPPFLDETFPLAAKAWEDRRYVK